MIACLLMIRYSKFKAPQKAWNVRDLIEDNSPLSDTNSWYIMINNPSSNIISQSAKHILFAFYFKTALLIVYSAYLGFIASEESQLNRVFHNTIPVSQGCCIYRLDIYISEFLTVLTCSSKVQQWNLQSAKWWLPPYINVYLIKN